MPKRNNHSLAMPLLFSLLTRPFYIVLTYLSFTILSYAIMIQIGLFSFFLIETSLKPLDSFLNFLPFSVHSLDNLNLSLNDEDVRSFLLKNSMIFSLIGLIFSMLLKYKNIRWKFSFKKRILVGLLFHAIESVALLVKIETLASDAHAVAFVMLALTTFSFFFYTLFIALQKIATKVEYFSEINNVSILGGKLQP